MWLLAGHHSVIRASALVSTTTGHQPWAARASPVSASVLVLIHPITSLTELKYSKSSLNPNCRWWVLKHVSMSVTSSVSGS